jgi:hypothetical protein
MGANVTFFFKYYECIKNTKKNKNLSFHIIHTRTYDIYN